MIYSNDYGEVQSLKELIKLYIDLTCFKSSCIV